MHTQMAEWQRWLDQAENDLAFGHHAVAGNYFHQACFTAQQSAGKGLMALLHACGTHEARGPSVVELLAHAAERNPSLKELNDLAAELDLFYIPTRYPNGLAEGTPHCAFTRTQAERGLAAARTILDAVRKALGARKA